MSWQHIGAATGRWSVPLWGITSEVLDPHLEVREAVQICQPSPSDAVSGAQGELPQLDQRAEGLQVTVQQELHREAKRLRTPTMYNGSAPWAVHQSIAAGLQWQAELAVKQ